MIQADAIRDYFDKNKEGNLADVKQWLDGLGARYTENSLSGHLSKLYSRGELKRTGTKNRYTYFK